MRSKRPIVILGPTAGGKSELAVRLAEQIPGGGEVIGADSMQVYKRLDAGTAKPTPNQRQRAAHHAIDLVEPTERFTVHDWLRMADERIKQVISRKQTPIVVGGTNLYLKALLEGLFDGPGRDASFRASLDDLPDDELHRRLNAIDPEAAERIAVADRQRLTRALEVQHLTGQPISAWQKQWENKPDRAYRHDPVLIGLRWPVDQINTRINLRVKAMFYPDKVDPVLAEEVCIGGESLPDETRRLMGEGWLGVPESTQADRAIGYAQCLSALSRRMTWDDAFEKTKIATRRFAKQQRTWLKRFQRVGWIDAEGLDEAGRCGAALAIHRANP